MKKVEMTELRAVTAGTGSPEAMDLPFNTRFTLFNGLSLEIGFQRGKFALGFNLFADDKATDPIYTGSQFWHMLMGYKAGILFALNDFQGFFNALIGNKPK